MNNSQKRKRISEKLNALFLLEVGGKCPLCGKYLPDTKAGEPIKLYEIAHIYPHSPTLEQIDTLANVPRAEDAESFENLIALCKGCHTKQDSHTTKEDYMRLYNMKKNY
jgi:5-methylcytosine-specific restriction endonuclease McrA